MEKDPNNNIVKLDSKTRKDLLKKRADQKSSANNKQQNPNGLKSKLATGIQFVFLLIMVFFLMQQCRM